MSRETHCPLRKPARILGQIPEGSLVVERSQMSEVISPTVVAIVGVRARSASTDTHHACAEICFAESD